MDKASERVSAIMRQTERCAGVFIRSSEMPNTAARDYRRLHPGERRAILDYMLHGTSHSHSDKER